MWHSSSFFMGRPCVLGGDCEHKALKLPLATDEGGDYVVYTENDSKNRSGSCKDRPDDNNVIKRYADSSLGEKYYC